MYIYYMALSCYIHTLMHIHFEMWCNDSHLNTTSVHMSVLEIKTVYCDKTESHIMYMGINGC